MKRIVWSSVGLALGVLFLVGAGFALFDDTVTCGGKTMQQGDVCVREKNGTPVSERNLEESKTDGMIGKIMGIAFGVAFTAVGAVNLRIGLRNRKAAAHAQHPAVLNQPGVNHPVPGPWNQAPGGPQGWPQQQYQPTEYQQPQHQQAHHQPTQHQHVEYQQAEYPHAQYEPPQQQHPIQYQQPQHYQPQYEPTGQQHPQHHQPPQHGWQQQYPPSGRGGGAWH
ncbi:hypothetical protein DMH04_42345 [Kibdelosporangium aridum]|uniref:Uncharacterized protein n=1 Tax=Kibdelosporangium aridum TaxID=2030 RepID=A0A428YT87_KIBAR|nr:hypothetical protein [Kibdelosporangium aridum]RSM72620.1 hypothetical protein DMH04_42345 [Kibdelosporangium aridum]